MEHMHSDAATGEEIAHHFLTIPYLDQCRYNWGTDSDRPSIWDIADTTTYINGVMVTIDRDYKMAFLLEVCDRVGDQTWVTYLAMEVRHRDLSAWEWMDRRPVPFFDRGDLTRFEVHEWFINWYEVVQEERDMQPPRPLQPERFSENGPTRSTPGSASHQRP